MLVPTLILGALTMTCAGQYSITSLPYDFTLAASNSTLPNMNATGLPLVLGQNGAITGAAFYVTSTYASYPYNDYPSLRLVNGSMHAFTTSKEWLTNATAMSSGSPLGWITSRYYSNPASKDYSAFYIPSERFPLLAAHGFTDLWSLCPFSGFRGQTSVIFNVSADIPSPYHLGFNPKDCYGVKLNVLQLSSLPWQVPQTLLLER